MMMDNGQIIQARLEAPITDRASAEAFCEALIDLAKLRVNPRLLGEHGGHRRVAVPTPVGQLRQVLCLSECAEHQFGSDIEQALYHEMVERINRHSRGRIFMRVPEIEGIRLLLAVPTGKPTKKEVHNG